MNQNEPTPALRDSALAELARLRHAKRAIQRRYYEQLIDCHEAGISLTQMGVALNMSRQSVASVVRRALRRRDVT